MIIFLIYISIIQAQIITEFQAIQSDDEPEWIEIYNDTENDIVIEKFGIADAINIKYYNSLSIRSKEFIVFTTDKKLLTEKYIISDNVENIIEFSFPTLNNTTDEIKIYNDNILIDSLLYDMKWIENQNSVERIDFEKDGTKENLTNSIDKKGGTPLKLNSIRIYDYDLKITNDNEISDSIVINIDNIGRNKLSKFDYEVYLDMNKDNTFDLMELVYSEIDYEIDTNLFINHYKYSFIDDLDVYGIFNLLFKITSNKDENRKNDTLTLNINFAPKRNSIFINEFLYEPIPENSEFIEIYNNSNFDINIKDLVIHDAQNENGSGTQIEKDYILKAADIVVLSSDSLILNNYNNLNNEKLIILNKNLSLNNGGDKILLKWKDGYLIDELEYFPKWHSSSLFNSVNISLEKKNPNLSSFEKDNWISSTDSKGATPTYPNSYIFKEGNDFGLKFPKNPFSFIEEDVIKIEYFCPFESSNINLSVFNKQGAKIGMITKLQFGGKYGEIIWDGTLNNQKLKSGSYVLFLEAVKSDTQEIYSTKELLVIVN